MAHPGIHKNMQAPSCCSIFWLADLHPAMRDPLVSLEVAITVNDLSHQSMSPTTIRLV